jgi:hypothetical protein
VFSKRDGSVFVTFPYFEHTTGIVSVVTAPGGSRSATLDLQPKGKVSSHLVKYSHHPDGTALFSQDGRVRSLIRKQSVPLAEMDGHLFTIHAHGLMKFREADKADAEDKAPNVKRTDLTFRFIDQQPESLKFLGQMFSVGSLVRKTSDGLIKPQMWLRDPGQKDVPAFVCAAPDGVLAHSCLLISCESLPRLDQSRESSLLFLGGFDESVVVRDRGRPTSCLALSYPLDNADELRRRIGSIDLVPPPDIALTPA